MHKNYTSIVPNAYYIKQLPELLFIQYDEDIEDKTRTMHAHDFWQLEFLVAGCMEVKSKAKKMRLEQNDCVLIAPGIPHRIYYRKWKQCVWSIKFKLEMENMPQRIIHLERTNLSLCARDNLSQYLNSNDSTPESYIVIQHILGMLLELEFQRNEVKAGSNFVTQLVMLIDSYEGRPVSVKELAFQMKCSRNTISSRFHKETGTTLKTFIDMRRLEIAKKMLLYSNLKITDIADLMGFADIYLFSRFFRTNQGCSPSQFRNHS